MVPQSSSHHKVLTGSESKVEANKLSLPLFCPSGFGPGGARLKRADISWRPPKRESSAWKVTQDVVSTIHEAARVLCQTSPCMKHKCRCRLGKKHWLEERAIFRYDTWDEYWGRFRKGWPSTAAKIASKEHPEICPRAFRENQPWYLRNKGGDSCLCQSCEGIEKKKSAAGATARYLEDYEASLSNNDASATKNGSREVWVCHLGSCHDNMNS